MVFLNLWWFFFIILEQTDEPTEDPSFPMDRQTAGCTECSECFCSPCVVHDNNRQIWWPTRNNEPHPGNASQRKLLYQRFWAMTANCGAWQDIKYIEKKKLARKSKTTWHKRELMPKCILTACRNWLPYPSGQPYLGHKWHWNDNCVIYCAISLRIGYVFVYFVFLVSYLCYTQ